jgi:hypothetical protein
MEITEANTHFFREVLPRNKYILASLLICVVVSLLILTAATVYASAADRPAILIAMKASPFCLLFGAVFAVLVNVALTKADARMVEYWRRLELTNNEYSCEQIEREVGLR